MSKRKADRFLKRCGNVSTAIGCLIVAVAFTLAVCQPDAAYGLIGEGGDPPDFQCTPATCDDGGCKKDFHPPYCGSGKCDKGANQECIDNCKCRKIGRNCECGPNS